MTLWDLGRLAREALQPSGAGCAGSQLHSKLRCQRCREQGHRESPRAASSGSSAARTGTTCSAWAHVAIGRSIWKDQLTAGKGGAHSSSQAGSPVSTGDADPKALAILQHSSPPGHCQAAAFGAMSRANAISAPAPASELPLLPADMVSGLQPHPALQSAARCRGPSLGCWAPAALGTDGVSLSFLGTGR